MVEHVINTSIGEAGTGRCELQASLVYTSFRPAEDTERPCLTNQSKATTFLQDDTGSVDEFQHRDGFSDPTQKAEPHH